MAVNYGSLVTAVGGVAIGALSAASGNKRAWTALNQRAELAQQQAQFGQDLAVTQDYEDYYIKLQESQQAKASVEMYSNTAGYVIVGLLVIGIVYLVKKQTAQ